MRLGTEIPASFVKSCECGKEIDSDGFHMITCKTGGGPVSTHESVANVWSECLRTLNITHHREPGDRYCNSNDRPDILAFDSDYSHEVELDISLAHPWNKDIINQSAREDGIAADKREDSKMRKYSAELDVWGNSSNCIPLVMEHFSHWGQQAAQYLHRLSPLQR